MGLQGWVTNTGNITLTNVTVVVDQPVANTPVFGPVDLPPGQAVPFSGSFIVPTNVGACSITSTLTVTGHSKCSGVAVTAPATAACPVLTAARIMITKTCPATPPPQGGTLVFTGTVANVGNITLTNILVLNNQPTSNTVVFLASRLAPGQVTNFTASYTVPTNCCSVTDTLTTSAFDECDGLPVYDTSTAICPVLYTPLIRVTKTCPTLPGIVGKVLTYSGTVSNAGNITLQGVLVYDSITGSSAPILEVGALAPGEVQPFTAGYTVPPDFCEPDTVTASGMSICGNSTVTDSATSACPVTTAPDIDIIGVAPAQPVSAGQMATFIGTVTNSGNVTLTNVQVVGSMPVPNTPVLGPVTLAPGQTTNFTQSYVVQNCDCCQVVNTYTATGLNRCASVQVVATSTIVTKFVTHPSISVALQCPTNGTTGQTVIVTGTVLNNGDCTLTNVVVVTGTGTQLVGPINLARGEYEEFTTSYTIGGSVNVVATAKDACTSVAVTASHSCGTVVPGTMMSVMAMGGQSVTLGWNSTAGVTYTVQWNTNLVGGSWVDVTGDVVATGSTSSKTVTLPPGAAIRYYRVRVVQ
jgi:uncharacterized repeat protein (TIGR01451 family)